MVYKKYIQKGGKTFGPYLYENYRDGGETKTRYLGKGENFSVKNSWGNLKNYLLIFGLTAIVLISIFLLVNYNNLSGKAMLDIPSSYVPGENITGNFNLYVKEGELIPYDSKIKVFLGGQEKEVLISDLININLSEGDYYAENSGLNGYGEGYGFIGEKKVYPEVYFTLNILEEELEEVGENETEVENNETQVDNEETEVENNETIEEPEEVIEEVDNSKVEKEDKGNKEEKGSKEEGKGNSDKKDNKKDAETQVDEASETAETSSDSGADNSESPTESESQSDSSESQSEAEQESPSESESSDEAPSDSGESENTPSESESSSDSGITGGIVRSFMSFFYAMSNAFTGQVSYNVVDSIEGVASQNNSFEYSLDEGESAEVETGSVRTSQGNISDDSLDLDFNGNEVSVTTDYYEVEEGFGEEYIIDESHKISIDLSYFNMTAEEGSLSVYLDYNGENIVNVSKTLSVIDLNDTLLETVLNETILNQTVLNETILNMTGGNASVETIQYQAVINKPVKWKKVVTLDDVNTGLVRVEIPAQAENITVYKIEGVGEQESDDIGGSELEVEDTENNSIDNNETGITNESIVNNSEGNIDNSNVDNNETGVNNSIDEVDSTNEVEEDIESSISGNAITGMVSNKDSNDFAKEDSSNKEKSKIPVNYQLISGKVCADIELDKETPYLKRAFSRFYGLITGKSVEVESNNLGIEPSENNEENTKNVIIDNSQNSSAEFEIEYETPAPMAFEENLSNGKKIVIYSEGELNYTNILAYTELPSEASYGIAKLYWLNDETRELVNVTEYDVNNNSLVDYIEWVVPHLSNQTYELIIEINKAEHLDSNRNFIEDVYSLVSERDDNWTSIPSGDYVRVSFEQNLTNKRDITIYARSNENSIVEVYEKDSDVKITQFDNVQENQMYKIYLTNLSSDEGYTQDTFDLRSVGNIEYDYIVDPYFSPSDVRIALTCDVAGCTDCDDLKNNLTAAGFKVTCDQDGGWTDANLNTSAFDVAVCGGYYNGCRYAFDNAADAERDAYENEQIPYVSIGIYGYTPYYFGITNHQGAYDASDDNIDQINTTHNIMTGFSGTVPVSTSGGDIGYLTPVQMVDPYSRLFTTQDVDDSYISGLAVDAGAATVGTTPNRFVHLGFSTYDTYPDEIKDDMQIIRQAICWAATGDYACQTNFRPIVDIPQLTPVSPLSANDLNCSFTVTDSDVGDTLTANVTWYTNDAVNFTVAGLSVTNGVGSSTILTSGNTSLGETWKCSVLPSDNYRSGDEKNSSAVEIYSSTIILDVLSPSDLNEVFNVVRSKWSEITLNVSCSSLGENCGTVNVSLDPSSTETMTITTGNTTETHNKAWYRTGPGGAPPQNPSNPGVGYSEYTASYYTNVDADDASLNNWLSLNNGYSLWYNFSINVSKGTISNIDVTWVGYDDGSMGGTPGDLYWWNHTSSSWVHWADLALTESTKEISFSMTSYDVNALVNDAGNLYLGAYGGWDMAKCPLVFTKTEEGTNFEFMLFGVYEDQGNYSSNITDVRLGKESEGYLYLNLEKETNELELIELPYETFSSDFYMLKVMDFYDGDLIIETNLSLVNASQGFEELVNEDGLYYQLRSRESLNLTFENIPEKAEEYDRQIQLVAKGWTDIYSETKMAEKKPFYQDKFYHWLTYEKKVLISSIITSKNLTYLSYPYEEDFEYEHHTMYDDYVKLEVTSSKGLISTIPETTPFYTNATTNPLTTASLNAGDSETVTFWVNATGELGTNHTFLVFANETASMTISDITQTWDSSIVNFSNSFPVTTTPYLAPTNPLTTDDLNCSFTIVDEDVGDTLTANVTWYKNNVTNFTVADLSATNGELAYSILTSGNTTLGETWKCSVLPNDGSDVGEEKSSSEVLIVAPIINLDVLVPSNLDEIFNATQNEFFNVTLSVSCDVTGGNCGTVNVSLDPESTTNYLPNMSGTAGWYESTNSNSALWTWNEIDQYTYDSNSLNYLSSYSSGYVEIGSANGRTGDLMRFKVSEDPSSITEIGVLARQGMTGIYCYGMTLSLYIGNITGNSWVLLDQSNNKAPEDYSGVISSSFSDFVNVTGEGNFVYILEHSTSSSSPGSCWHDNFYMNINVTSTDGLKSGLISTIPETTPFYTNATTNPLTTASLNAGDSETVTFWVNATGEVDTSHVFFAYANLTSNLSVGNLSGDWNVSIVSLVIPNNAPNNPAPSIISLDGTNSPSGNLNCSSIINDSDAGNKINVSFIWYKGDIVNLSLDYNNNYDSGTSFGSDLGKGNLSVGDSWKCGMKLFDGALYSLWVNSSALTIVDTISPTVSIIYPTATSYATDVTSLDYIASDSVALSSCWYSLDLGTTNSTTQACGLNWTGLTSVYGSNTWTVYANDTSNNVGNSSVTFTRLSPAVNLNVLVPSNLDEIFNATQNEFFNVSLSVSCDVTGGNCGTVNVSLDPVSCPATGGVITTDGSYCVHTFTSNGTFEPTFSSNAEVLVVAGGGGGAAMTGGGGGAGGLIYDASHAITAQSYTVVIGQGGPGQIGTANPGYGSDGANSSFDNLIAAGGGGAGTNAAPTGRNGGSGGGCGHVSCTGGLGVAGQGNNAGSQATTAPNYGASGGGGAGQLGFNGTNTAGGDGGDGLEYSINGTAVYYAGGGGGGSYPATGILGIGGLGGGGSAPAGNGVENTGGGGAGQYNNLANGGNGGSGIVIIRYLSPSKSGLISTTAGTTPFYTNATTNPLTTASLNAGDSETVTFWVNATGEVDTSHVFFAYANVTSNLSVGNLSGDWNVSIIVDNVAPTNPTVDLLSVDETNTTTSDLNCSATITDDDADSLDVTIKWYKFGVEHLSVDYNNSYASGYLFSGILDSDNTSKGQNWTCGIRVYDGTTYSLWVNSSQLVILNSPPTATLLTPEDNNITYERTPSFTWDGIDADTSDTLTYDLNVSCYPGCSIDSQIITSIASESETLEQELHYLSDNGFYYNWSVRAYDGFVYSSWTPERKISLQSLLTITLINNTVLFGNVLNNQTEDTADNSPAPLVIQNDGNALMNITVNVTSLFVSSSSPSSNYRIKAANSSEGWTFNWIDSVTTWINAPLTTTLIIAGLNYSDSQDTAEIDLEVTVPYDEAPGNKSSLITFTSSLGE